MWTQKINRVCINVAYFKKRKENKKAFSYFWDKRRVMWNWVIWPVN